jgi:hypothetical protein
LLAKRHLTIRDKIPINFEIYMLKLRIAMVYKKVLPSAKRETTFFHTMNLLARIISGLSVFGRKCTHFVNVMIRKAAKEY